jgi:hypothetical protein
MTERCGGSGFLDSPAQNAADYLPFFKESRTGIPVVKNRPWIELTSVQR